MTLSMLLLGASALCFSGGAIAGIVDKITYKPPIFHEVNIPSIMYSCGITKGDSIPRLIEVCKNDIGTKYTVQILEGMSINDYLNKQDQIAQAIGQDVEIYLENYLAVIQTLEKQLKQEYSLDLSNYKPSGMRFGVGRDRSDQEVMLDLTGEVTHTLVVGTTGSGKSVALNVLLTQMVLSQVEISVIDMKSVEFILYRDYKHLQGWAINEDGAYKVLQETLEEMNRRYELLLKHKCKNYKDYNKKYPKHKIKPRVLLIDEFQSLMDDKASKKLLFMLLSKARASNIVIVLCCQSPRYEIVDGRLRDNILNYLIFRCETDKASEVATATQGDYRATKLRGSGHGLLKSKGQYTEFQGYYLSDDDIQRYIKPYNTPYKPQEKQQGVIDLDRHKEAVERKIDVNLDMLDNL